MSRQRHFEFAMSHGARRLALVLALGLAVAGPAQAREVRMFDDAPSVEELRRLLVPESAGAESAAPEPVRRTRSIEIIAGAPAKALAQPRPEAPQPSPAAYTVATPPPGAPVPPPARMPQPEPEPRAPRAEPVRLPPAAPAVAAPAPAPDSARERPAVDEATAIGFRINFAFNSAEIPREAFPFLDKIGWLLQLEPRLCLTVEGHTDGRGSDAYNLDLSRRRAEAVKSYLTYVQGIAPSRLTVAGKGKREPLNGNPFDGRNRRVQFQRIS